MPLTVELAVHFSSRTQCKRCSTGAYIINLANLFYCKAARSGVKKLMLAALQHRLPKPLVWVGLAHQIPSVATGLAVCEM